MSERPRLHLIDGSGYIFRAYYAIRPLSTSAGLPTNAVVGFARMVGKLLREEEPKLLGIAFDTAEKTFRHHLFAEYKANRDAPPEDLVPQFELIRELVAAMNVPVLAQPGYEADDVLATLAARAVEAGHDVVLVSGDKDLMQLVGPGVTMLDPMKGKRYDREAVIERFGVPPERVADVQALAGDSTDNIPGVPKVGPKSAAKLVAAYGDVEQVISGLQKQSQLKAFERAVLEHAEAARLSKRLTVLATDAPVQLDLQKLLYQRPPADRLGPFLRRIEAQSLLRDFGLPSAADSDARPTGGPEAARAGTGAPGVGAIDRSTYRVILTLEQLDEVLDEARRAAKLSVDLETTSLDANRADIVGIALCAPGAYAAYVPVGHRVLGDPRQLSRSAAVERLRPVLEDDGIDKVGQNLKYDYLVFRRAGITLAGIREDSMLAAYVLDPAKPSYAMDALAREVLGHTPISYKDVVGRGKDQLTFDQVPIDKAAEYAAEDADVALRLCDVLGKRVRGAGLGAVYDGLEMPLLPVLAEMERAGVLVDIKALGSISRHLTERLAETEARAHTMIGRPLNLASPKQLSHLFFEELGYPVVKKTKTGFSTDQEVLETLARTYELPAVILEHRLLAKLKSTYADALPRMVNPETGRVHTSFNQTGAATGRLSSSEPNLQNIPVRTDEGRRIREAFIAEDGWGLISADYSQIELRVLAHLCGDESFIEAFERGEDIHRRTAKELLSAGQEPDAEMRRRAKAVNFGIIYGQSDFGLAKQLNIPRAEARDYIESYFGRHPRIRAFFETTIGTARDSGFVTTLSGRRRFLPELRSQNGNLRKAAERIAMNTPIQGSAADIIKGAMLRVAERLRGRNDGARMLLQVHDELLLEAPLAQVDEIANLVREEMSQAMRLAVPLEVDVGTGPNWAAAH